MDENFKKIINLISEKASLEVEEVKRESSFEEDLNLSEMDVIELLTDLEDMFEVEVEEEAKEEIATVQELVELIEERL